MICKFAEVEKIQDIVDDDILYNTVAAFLNSSPSNKSINGSGKFPISSEGIII